MKPDRVEPLPRKGKPRIRTVMIQSSDYGQQSYCPTGLFIGISVIAP